MARLLGEPNKRTSVKKTTRLTKSSSSFISKKNAERTQEPRRYPIWLTRAEAEILMDFSDMDSALLLEPLADKARQALNLKIL